MDKKEIKEVINLLKTPLCRFNRHDWINYIGNPNAPQIRNRPRRTCKRCGRREYFSRVARKTIWKDY